MSKLEILIIEIKCWFLDVAEALFSGQYKRNRRETRKIIDLAKKLNKYLKDQAKQ